jgi:hypothetical protein
MSAGTAAGSVLLYNSPIPTDVSKTSLSAKLMVLCAASNLNDFQASSCSMQYTLGLCFTLRQTHATHASCLSAWLPVCGLLQRTPYLFMLLAPAPDLLPWIRAC